ncbi:M24 family metallopeptidase [Clostridium sp. C105KSO13]|uniref:M24 family metallopeptidase n=1 Tax=Clostridium sp. C105KSO13 TaxID=1776045 RepID=UPI00074088E0|nr:Xaa-Pro peptidase family protein [Clostridium sp. C105KSO13]CUX16427.1 Xaa-Pro dipeptidase [Clostridium sp. C105KSO13]
MSGKEKVFKNMIRRGIDMVVLVNPANVKYVSGFDVPFWPAWMGDVSNGLPMITAVLSAEKQTMKLVASDLYKTKIIRSGIRDANIYRSFTYLEENDVDLNYEEMLGKTLEELGNGKQRPVIGVEPNFAVQHMLQIIGRTFPRYTFENATQILADSRYIKTAEDIKGLQEAARVADAAQNKLYEISKHEGNYTELDIWFEVQKAASKAAGCLTPFVGELVTGSAAGLSDYPLGPEDRKVEKGDIAIMDISPRVNGYWGDCSNSVVFWDRPDEEQKKYFTAVKAAFDAGARAIRPGVKFNEVNHIMEEEYSKRGMNFCSYQGHQIGCNVNEKPRFTYVDDAVIEKDMVLCIEPQMYTGKAGKTGVRLERMLHVTEKEVISLNKFPWGIE